MKSFLILLALLCLMPTQAVPHRPDMVVVVDDDSLDLFLAEHYMKEYDCVVTTIRHSAEALRRIKDDWFDIAFVDLKLHDMTAIEFMKQAQPKNQRLKWFVMSDGWIGQGGIRMLREVMDMGAQAIVKSSSRHAEPMKSFKETLALILKPKHL